MSSSQWRLRIGATVFVVGFACPLLIPLVAASGLPGALKTALSGVLLAGLPEVGMIAGVAIMGKDGLARLKARFGRLLAPILPPSRVGPVRHRIGLCLFVLPLLLGWAGPYFGSHLPGHSTHGMAYAIACDVSVFCSLFVLGGEFWDKLKALFDRDARVAPYTAAAGIELEEK